MKMDAVRSILDFNFEIQTKLQVSPGAKLKVTVARVDVIVCTNSKELSIKILGNLQFFVYHPNYINHYINHNIRMIIVGIILITYSWDIVRDCPTFSTINHYINNNINVILVGGIPTLLKKKVSWDDEIPNI